MSAVRSRRVRRTASWPLIVCALVLLGVAWLAWDGRLRLGSEGGGTSDGNGRVAAEGEVHVLAPARRLAPYTEVRSEHLIDPLTGRLSTVIVSEEVAEERGLFRDLGQVLGRVTATEKLPGRAFREGNFLPVGTRPGVVAGVPPGYRGLTVDVENIVGMHLLQPGDRFDIAQAVPVDERDVASLSGAGNAVFEQVLPIARSFSGLAQQANVRFVVQNGVVVTGMELRQKPVAKTGLTSFSVRNVPVQEMTVAVRAEEAPLLLQALAIEADLTCMPRSGTPGSEDEQLTPDHVPWNPFGLDLAAPRPSGAGQGAGGSTAPKADAGGFRMIETVVGGERRYVPVRQAGGSP